MYFHGWQNNANILIFISKPNLITGFIIAKGERS
jgi:hypothetical protein